MEAISEKSYEADNTENIFIPLGMIILAQL